MMQEIKECNLAEANDLLKQGYYCFEVLFSDQAPCSDRGLIYIMVRE